jgi:hypothetical protein
MNCSQCEHLLAAHLEGLLNETAVRQLEAHVAECRACAMSLEQTQRLFDRLNDDGDRVRESSIVPAVMDRIIDLQALRLRRIGIMKHVARIFVAAAVLVGLAIALLHGTPKPFSKRAYAADLSVTRSQIEEAKTATWKVCYYQRFLGAGGAVSRWFRCKNSDQRYAYKSPGLYRCEQVGEDGEVEFYSIEDVANRAKLDVNHMTRTATLTYLVESSFHPRGPFAKYLEPMEHWDLGLLEKEDVAGRPANGFRYEFHQAATHSDRSLDFWLDAASKRLVLCQDPGRDLFDTREIVSDIAYDMNDQDPIEYGGTTWSAAPIGEGVSTGHIISEVAFDVKLDDSLFVFGPPPGYAFKTVEPPPIAEQDVLEFMRVVA